MMQESPAVLTLTPVTSCSLYQTELCLAAREAAYSEYRAVVSRSQVITEEVAALVAAACDLACLRAERSVRAAPPARAGGFLSPGGVRDRRRGVRAGLGSCDPTDSRHANLTRPVVRLIAASSMRSPRQPELSGALLGRRRAAHQFSSYRFALAHHNPLSE